jgi:hypothetical protein
MDTNGDLAHDCRRGALCAVLRTGRCRDVCTVNQAEAVEFRIMHATP